MEEQKRDKSELVNKLVRIVVMIFSCEISLKFIVKSLLHSLFFTDHVKQKNANKTTCRTPSSNSHQLCAH